MNLVKTWDWRVIFAKIAASRTTTSKCASCRAVNTGVFLAVHKLHALAEVPSNANLLQAQRATRVAVRRVIVLLGWFAPMVSAILVSDFFTLRFTLKSFHSRPKVTCIFRIRWALLSLPLVYISIRIAAIYPYDLHQSSCAETKSDDLVGILPVYTCFRF